VDSFWYSLTYHFSLFNCTITGTCVLTQCMEYTITGTCVHALSTDCTITGTCVHALSMDCTITGVCVHTLSMDCTITGTCVFKQCMDCMDYTITRACLNTLSIDYAISVGCVHTLCMDYTITFIKGLTLPKVHVLLLTLSCPYVRVRRNTKEGTIEHCSVSIKRLLLQALDPLGMVDVCVAALSYSR